MSKAQRKEKAETQDITKIGGNIQPLKDDLVKFRNQIIQLKSKRSEINADIQAIMESAESKGIPKKSLRNALAYYESSPEQREGYHDGYALCLEAWGMPVSATQAEFFSEVHPATSEDDE